MTMDTVDVDAFAFLDDPVDEVDAEVDVEVDDETDNDAPAAPVVLRVEDGLTERERQILAFERQWWRRAGAKEQAIRDLFGISSTRYYQLLNGLLDSQPALAYDPVLVQRLRRLRASRTRTRTARS